MVPEYVARARGERILACPQWEFRPGVLLYGGDRVTEHTLGVSDGAFPDFDDPGSLGVLIAIAREFWRAPGMYAYMCGSEGWAINCPKGPTRFGPTEADAWIAALETVPNRWPNVQPYAKSFHVDVYNCDEGHFYVDVAGYGTVAISTHSGALYVDIYPSHVVDTPVAHCTATLEELSQKEEK